VPLSTRSSKAQVLLSAFLSAISGSSGNLARSYHRLNYSKDQERVDFFFEASVWQGEVKNVEPEKCDNLTWFAIDNLPDDIIPHVRLVLEKCLKVSTIQNTNLNPKLLKLIIKSFALVYCMTDIRPFNIAILIKCLNHQT